MKTDVIQITNAGENMNLALDQAERMAVYKDLPARDALHLRLLTEEMMGIMRSITGESRGMFWIEDVDKVYSLHLRVNTIIDAEMRKRLLASSSSGTNEASRSLMGRLREFFFRDVDDEIANYSSPILVAGANPLPLTDWQWSLTRYQSTLSDKVKKEEKDAVEAWDELEKSVVFHVADDIRISIKGWQTEMTILKKFD